MKIHSRRGLNLFRVASFWMFLLLAGLAGCNKKSEFFPAAENFNEKDSDKEAIEIADRMMGKMGGYEAWEKARFVAWGFFGQYQIWDKKENLFRHEKENLVCIMNLKKSQGKVFLNGIRMTDSTQVMTKLSQAYTHWVYNQYFLILPYKMKEAGATLKYRGEGKTAEGRPADIVRITFDSVAVSSENMHDLYIDKETSLPVQWAFYGTRQDSVPAFIRKWADVKDFNGVKISTNHDSREDKLPITDVAVTNSIDKELFLSAVPIDRSKVK